MPPTLSEAQQKALALARARFRGKALVMHGGAWTAEAREPQRKKAGMEQLELAHKIRKQLEEAAEKAESEDTRVGDVQKLILEQFSAMNRLVSLTEAAKSGYVLHDYEEYNNWATSETERQQEALAMAEVTLRNQIQRIDNPDRTWPSRIKVEPADAEEPRKMPLPRQEEDQAADEEAFAGTALNPVARMQVESEDDEPAFRSRPTAAFTLKAPPPQTGRAHQPDLNIRGHVLAMQERMQIARDQTRSKRRRESGAENRKKKSKSEPKRASLDTGEIARTRLPTVDQHSKRKSLPSKLREETGFIVRPPTAMANRADADARPDNVSSMVSPSTKTAAPRKRTGPRRCHNCKTVQANYIKCKFVMPTGCRCGKTYCTDCLEKNYEGQSKPDNVDEWHCPACLGICKCNSCQAQREKDKRREALIKEMQRSKPTRRSRSSTRFSYD